MHVAFRFAQCLTPTMNSDLCCAFWTLITHANPT